MVKGVKLLNKVLPPLRQQDSVEGEFNLVTRTLMSGTGNEGLVDLLSYRYNLDVGLQSNDLPRRWW